MKNFYEIWFLVPRLITIALLVACAAWMSRGRIDPKTHCAKCGYNLNGNVSGICPECGRPVPQAGPTLKADR